MKLKQLMLSLCLECVDIRLGGCSLYTIINNEVVYFEAGGEYVPGLVITFTVAIFIS